MNILIEIITKILEAIVAVTTKYLLEKYFDKNK
jgi:hypothetical protein